MSTLMNDTAPVKKQPQKELERELIKSLAGNYRVDFKFCETFSPDKNYDYHDRYFSSAKEVALLIEETADKVSLQHILYAGKILIKHWRQDWLYENREIWELVKDHEWKKTSLSPEQAKGTWTQKVYQVDDAPRYEGYGTWIHVDGRHYWESTADAALPRREISTAARHDYNILRRHSHIEIFRDGGWIIEQDNDKIKRNSDCKETLICMEKGLETFKPKPYDEIKVKQLWENQKEFWAQVRQLWAEIRRNQDYIRIRDNEGLYKRQFELAEKFSGQKYDREKARFTIKSLLAEHIEGGEI